MALITILGKPKSNYRIVGQFFLLLNLFCLQNSFAQEQWRHFAYLNPGKDFSAVYIGGGNVLVTAGSYDALKPANSVSIININKPFIRTMDTLHIARMQCALLATPDSNALAIGGSIWVGYAASGSYEGKKLTSTVELFDHSLNSWRDVGKLLTARRSFGAMFINKDEVIVVGGYTDLQYNISTSKSEIFNVRNGQSRRIADFPLPCANLHINTTETGEIVAFGGADSTFIGRKTNIVYRYNPSADAWIAVDTLNTGGTTLMSVLKLWDGRLLISGGCPKSAWSFGAAESTIWISKGTTFQTMAQLITPRFAHAMAQYSKDEVLIFGGMNDSLHLTPKVEILNIQTGVIQPFAKEMWGGKAFGKFIVIPKYKGDDNIPYTSTILAIDGIDYIDSSQHDGLRPTSYHNIERFSDDCSFVVEIKYTDVYRRDLCFGQAMDLSYNFPSTYASSQWSTGRKNRSSTSITSYGRYWVEVKTKDSCYGYGEVTIAEPPPLFELLHVYHTTQKNTSDTLFHKVVVVLKNPLSIPGYIVRSTYEPLYSLHNAFAIRADSISSSTYVELQPGEVDSIVIRYATLSLPRGPDTIVIAPTVPEKTSATPCPFFIILRYNTDGSASSDSVGVGTVLWVEDIPKAGEKTENKDIIFPNPACKAFRIKNQVPGSIITIYSVIGQRIVQLETQEYEESVDVHLLPVGQYIVTMSNPQYEKMIYTLTIVR